MILLNFDILHFGQFELDCHISKRKSKNTKRWSTILQLYQMSFSTLEQHTTSTNDIFLTPTL